MFMRIAILFVVFIVILFLWPLIKQGGTLFAKKQVDMVNKVNVVNNDPVDKVEK